MTLFEFTITTENLIIFLLNFSLFIALSVLFGYLIILGLFKIFVFFSTDYTIRQPKINIAHLFDKEMNTKGFTVKCDGKYLSEITHDGLLFNHVLLCSFNFPFGLTLKEAGDIVNYLNSNNSSAEIVFLRKYFSEVFNHA
ncbi:hypothetical protein [Aliivibrio fischeri]|uniref:Uncharacterized protein n=1 Tax=Aliivibrio fischeri TaxID=668 RepID=A0A844P7U3_ALIFS|nr:hypothetical protein [Aliivibrio fischeri]MUK51434.1 hypothetical protein [Aliivibrio fischeri]